jgi:DNA-binding GntR family transcriptional regulator
MAPLEQSLPAYEQIARAVRDRVMAGALAPGDRAPSQNEIMGEWEVSRATANKATALLKSWGVVETKVGSATRVAPLLDGIPVSSPQDHSSRMLRGVPLYTEGETSEIYEASVISTAHVGDAVIQAVGLPSPDPTIPTETTTIIKRARRMYRGERLAGVCTTWINNPLVAQQPAGDDAVEKLTSLERIPGGTGRLLTDLFGVEHTHDTTRVGVRGLPVSVARELREEAGNPMLWVLATRFAGEYVIEVDEWFRYDDIVFS